jgi:hypothetical protein
MPGTNAVSRTDGLDLLEGIIRRVVDVKSSSGTRKVLFTVGDYTGKAFGSDVDKIKNLEGQTVKLIGKWEKLYRYPDKKEFIFKSVKTETCSQTILPTSEPDPSIPDEEFLREANQLASEQILESGREQFEAELSDVNRLSVFPRNVIGVLTNVRQVSPKKAIGQVGDFAVAVFEGFDIFKSLVGKKMKFVGRWQTTQYGNQFIINARHGAGNEIIEDALPAAANKLKEDHSITHAAELVPTDMSF